MRSLMLPLGLVFVLASCDATDPPTNEAQESNNAPSAAEAPAATFRPIAGESVFAMIVPANATAEQLPSAAREHCGQREFCQVHGWMSDSDAAKTMPMTDREVATMAFKYAHNRTTGFEQRMWDCERWKRSDGNECLSRD